MNHIDYLKTERQKLRHEMQDNISMVRAEFSPKINALSLQIERITGKPESKTKEIVSKQKARAMMRNAKNMR